MNFFKKNYPVLVIFALVTLTFSACKDDDEPTAVDCDNFQWAYEGNEGPANWFECNTDCGGTVQSPIDVTGAQADASLTALSTHFEAVPVELINNGHTVEFEYEAGSKLTLNGADFELLQFHFHTESEHTVNGTHYPMEAHLVHKNNATGALAVIGIFFEEGAENVFLKNFSDNLPAAKDDHVSDSATTVDVTDLLPADNSYFTYSGSLTTPPCSEIVTWLVMKTPVEASADQISKFHTIMHDNNRPIQGLNGRTITEF